MSFPFKFCFIILVEDNKREVIEGERSRKMAELRLTNRETDMLRQILQKHLGEVTFETAFTHRKDYVHFLQERRQFIEGLIERL